MKKSLSILLTILLTLSLFTICAYAQDETIIDQGTCGENAKYVLTEDGTLTISPIDPSLENATVYESFFYNTKKITNVIVEEGITVIEERAFEGCNNVESISLPDTLVREDGAIDNMPKLKSIHIPANLRHIVIENPDYPVLEEITVDTKNPYFDSRDNCNALFLTSTDTLVIGCKNTVIPASTKHIRHGAFSSCIELKSVSLPEGLLTIGQDAFSFCISLESVILPSTLTSLGDEAFSGCVSLKKAVLSENLETIPGSAFSVCLDLKEVTIPEGVKEIGQDAFTLSSLEEVTLPQSLEKINKGAFDFTYIKKFIVKSKTVDLSESEAVKSPFLPEKADEASSLLHQCYAIEYKQHIDTELGAEMERIYNEIEAFANIDEETGSTIYTAIPGVTIVGYQGSTAQAYAVENGIDFTSCPLGEHTNIQYNTDGYEATCTEKGFIGGSACLDCETVLEMPEIIPANGHTVVIDKAVEATCTTMGLTEGKHCSVCNEDIVPQVIIPATGHTDADGDNICDNCHEPVDSEEEIQLTFIERMKRVFSNIINSIIALFKRLFG